MSDESIPKKELYRIRSKDNEEFLVEPASFQLLTTLSECVGSLGASQSEVVPVNKVTGATMRHVLRYADHHSANPAAAPPPNPNPDGDNELTDWDREFFAGMNSEELGDVFTAADYLNMSGLLAICAKRVASIVKGKGAAELKSRACPQPTVTPN